MSLVTRERPALSWRMWAVVIAMAAIASMTLSGCASGSAGAAPDPTAVTPETSATAATNQMVAGQGSTGFPGVAFVIPPDARSVVVDFECAGGGDFSVELGDSMMLGQAPLSGTCDGTSRLTWPITERTSHTLAVIVPDGVDWVASPTFSAEEFAYDSALAADCATFSEIYSALVNADTGYTHYSAFDAGEWTSRVDRAAADLAALAASAQSSLGEAFERVRVVVDDPGRTVGSVLTDTALVPIGEIGQACNTNQTPLVLNAEFGG